MAFVSENMEFVTNLSDLHTDICEEMREKFIDLATHIEETLPEGRTRSLALTNVEQGLMWAINATVHSKKSELM